jgi:hypothetical protein
MHYLRYLHNLRNDENSTTPRHPLYHPLLRLVLNLGLTKLLLNHRNIMVKGPDN